MIKPGFHVTFCFVNIFYLYLSLTIVKDDRDVSLMQINSFIDCKCFEGRRCNSLSELEAPCASKIFALSLFGCKYPL